MLRPYHFLPQLLSAAHKVYEGPVIAHAGEHHCPAEADVDDGKIGFGQGGMSESASQSYHYYDYYVALPGLKSEYTDLPIL